MWIARDRDGKLKIFNNKPHLHLDKDWQAEPGDIVFKHEVFVDNQPNSPHHDVYPVYDQRGYIEINSQLFPKIKFEHSPVECIPLI